MSVLRVLGVFGDASNGLFVSRVMLAQRLRRAQRKNKLPSTDIEVLLSPLLRVQGVRRVQARSVKLFVVFKHAPNRLFVSGVILISPLLPFGLSSPVSERASLLLKCGTYFPPFEKSLCLALT